MDKILLQGLRFKGFHGLEAQEREHGQLFVVDVELHLDLTTAGRLDDLAATVDYSRVVDIVRSIVEGEMYGLVETLAEIISRRLLEAFPVDRVLIRVKKPEAPIEGGFDYLGVEIDRCRLS